MSDLEAIRYEFESQDVEDVFLSHSEPLRSNLLYLRELIFETASENPEIGTIEESLKWGQPSYATVKPKTGSPIRVDKLKGSDDKFALYFICTTNLVDSYQELYPDKFNFVNGRGIVFNDIENVNVLELKDCIQRALMYHKNKRKSN